MVWHDCKTDPPKKVGEYIVAYWFYKDHLSWECGLWKEKNKRFEAYDPEAHYEEGRYVDFKEMYGEPYKWAEVDLSEVE